MRFRLQTFLTLAAAALLVSCNEEEAARGEEGLVAVSLSAAVDGGGQSRATATEDDEITRCLVQVLENEEVGGGEGHPAGDDPRG